jgi:large subunit ribosomal protein L21
MFAVIKSGGRQYKVSVGDRLEVNRLPVEDGAQVRFEEVLLISDADNSMIGAPLVENAVVLATALRQARGKKVTVFKYKAKKRYRHRRGHRQELTVLTIDDIVADGKSLITGEAPRSRDEETPVEDELVTPTTTSETETETPVSEAPETETEQKTTRRRRTGSVEDAEDSESETEEE